MQTNSGPFQLPCHESHKLDIIFGVLGTLIAFATLILAILKWFRSRRQRLAAQREESVDVELGSDISQRSEGTLESQAGTNADGQYVAAIEDVDGKRLTLHSDSL